MDGNVPLISVIVPVYNAEIYLERCVNSIRLQTYDNLEIILIDDGSKDRSGKICDNLAEQDDRIRVIHQNNEGQASARNRGLTIATGELIGFVDNDDVIDSHMYEILYKIKLEHNVKVSGIVADWIYSDHIISPNSNFESRFYPSIELSKNMLNKRGLISSSVWDKLFDKDLFDEIKFPDGCEYEDYWVLTQILLNIEGIYIQTLPLYHWYQYDSSQSKTGFHEKSKTYIEVSKEIRSYYQKLNCDKELIDAATNFILISYIKFFGKVFKSNAEETHKNLLTKYKKELYNELSVSITLSNISKTIKIKCLILASPMSNWYGKIRRIRHNN